MSFTVKKSEKLFRKIFLREAKGKTLVRNFFKKNVSARKRKN